MSLILEALRKSEAERRRGVAPDVAMELPPTPVARDRAMPPWLPPLLVAGALAILATFWWSRRTPDAPARAASPQVDQTAQDTPPAPIVVARTRPQPVAPPPAPAAPVASPPAPTATIEPQQAPAPLQTPPLPATPAPAAPRDAIASIDDTALPPVKLSMHMWDASPARRFVILDGQRMAEGDRKGEITVLAIERDGVVIERNGQRARVPLP